jgi:hypothetical protein
MRHTLINLFNILRSLINSNSVKGSFVIYIYVRPMRLFYEILKFYSHLHNELHARRTVLLQS